MDPAITPTEPAAPSFDGSSSRIKVDPTKDLWQNIVQNVKDAETGGGSSSDQTVLVVGAKGSGKTSIVNRLLGSAAKAKPTTALEYSFGKRDDRASVQVAHFWELAQGTQLSQLADVVVTAENVHLVTLVIVVDCGDVASMFSTCSHWLKHVDRRVTEIFQKMKSKGSTTPDKLIAKAKRMVGEDHPDISRMRFSGIPTVIVCNRLDGFKGDSTRLKLMARTMRHVAHLYGAFLIFTSDHTAEVSKLRTLMNHLIFQMPMEPRLVGMDPERGSVFVTPDRDSFADIGDPNAANMADYKSTGDAELDRWKAAFDEMFPAKQSKQQQAAADSAKLAEDPFLKKLYDTTDGFGEPAIDSMRKQKDEELEQYRRNSAKKAAEGKKGDEKDA